MTGLASALVVLDSGAPTTDPAWDDLAAQSRREREAGEALAKRIFPPVTEARRSDPAYQARLREMTLKMGFDAEQLDLTRDPEPIAWAVQRVIEQDSVNLIAAPPGSLKTWVLYSLALALAEGTPWLGAYAVPDEHNVLIVDWESGRERATRRLQLLARGRDVLGITYVRPPMPMQHPDFWPMLHATIQRLRADVVLIDSLSQGSSGVDENSVEAAEPLRKAAMLDGVTFVFLHHSGKGEGTAVRGTSAFTGAADSIYTMTKATGDRAAGERSTMTLEKRGDGEQEERIPLVLTDAGGLQLDTDGGALAAHPAGSELATRILELLKRGGPKTVEEIRHGVGKKATTVRAEVKSLQTDGYLVQIDRRYRIDSPEARWARVMLALASLVFTRKEITRRARLAKGDLDDMAAKGWIGCVGENVSQPSAYPAAIPPVGMLGLSDEDAATVRKLFDAEPLSVGQ